MQNKLSGYSIAILVGLAALSGILLMANPFLQGTGQGGLGVGSGIVPSTSSQGSSGTTPSLLGASGSTSSQTPVLHHLNHEYDSENETSSAFELGG